MWEKPSEGLHFIPGLPQSPALSKGAFNGLGLITIPARYQRTRSNPAGGRVSQKDGPQYGTILKKLIIS